MLFTRDNLVAGLFGDYPLGTRLGVGTGSSFWVGSFGGVRNGVAILTKAQLFANIGKPVDDSRSVVQIPICQITFVAE